jgi:hypothetical protein
LLDHFLGKGTLKIADMRPELGHVHRRIEFPTDFLFFEPGGRPRRFAFFAMTASVTGRQVL